MQADTIFPLSAEAGDVHRVDVQLFADWLRERGAK